MTFVLVHGTSCGGWIWRRVAKLLRAQGQTFRAVPTVAALGVTDPADTDWLQRRLTPQPYHTYDQPVPAGTRAGAALPRAFIRCTLGPGVTRFAASVDRVRGQMGTVRDLAASHFVMITAPGATADLLVEISATR